MNGTLFFALISLFAFNTPSTNTRTQIRKLKVSGTNSALRTHLWGDLDLQLHWNRAGLPRQILNSVRVSEASQSLHRFLQPTRVALRVLQVEVRTRIG